MAQIPDFWLCCLLSHRLIRLRTAKGESGETYGNLPPIGFGAGANGRCGGGSCPKIGLGGTAKDDTGGENTYFEPAS